MAFLAQDELIEAASDMNQSVQAADSAVGKLPEAKWPRYMDRLDALRAKQDELNISASAKLRSLEEADIGSEFGEAAEARHIAYAARGVAGEAKMLANEAAAALGDRSPFADSGSGGVLGAVERAGAEVKDVLAQLATATKVALWIVVAAGAALLGSVIYRVSKRGVSGAL